MILGNQVEWALHCMMILAGMPQGVQVPAKYLAEFHGVPKEYLSKALQSLAAAGLVHTSLGPKGGYSLARAADKINMLEVVEAVEGRQNTFNCQEIRRNNPCEPKLKKMKLPVCSIAGAMYEADNAWRDVLRKKKLSDLAKEIQISVDEKILEKSAEWCAEKI